MADLYINPISKKIIDSTIRNLPQSILIYGEIGCGLSAVCNYICSQSKVRQIVILPEKDDAIDIEKGIINVKMIRDLYDVTKTKSRSKVAIIINYAERMTVQAQNAFLKLLEEPNHNTHFILLSHSITNLKPTIISRVQKVHIKPISKADTNRLLDDLKISDNTKRSQLSFMADGLPAEITRLASDDLYFEKRSQIIKDAKQLLSQNVYEKLIIINSYKDKRELALMLVLDLIKILKINLKSDNQAKSIKKIDSLLNTYEDIASNGNIRISLVKSII